MSDYFIIVRFSQNLTVKAVTDPITLYQDFPSAELAAIAFQQANTDNSQFAICEAVAITQFLSPQVGVVLLNAQVPTST